MEKETKKGSCCGGKSPKDMKEMKEIAIEKIKVGFDELEKTVKDLKGKYDNADDKTKKKVLAGVAGAAALLGAIVAGKAIKNKLKK